MLLLFVLFVAAALGAAPSVTAPRVAPKGFVGVIAQGAFSIMTLQEAGPGGLAVVTRFNHSGWHEILWFNFPTADARNSNGHFSFTGRGMTERTHEQIFASLSGVFISSTAAIMNGHISYRNERWRIWTERGKVYVKPSSVELLPPPVVFPGAGGGGGEEQGAPAAEGVSRSHAARTSDAADRLAGFSTGRSLLSVPTSFAKLRLVVLFDQAVCTAEEWTIFSNIKSMFVVVWSHNMKMTNWEILYRCQTVTDGSGTMDRNSFAAAARRQVDFRKKYGADVLLVIGLFTYEQWWRAAGDLGPSPTAVTTSMREAAAEILVIPHEVGHNWGMDHDRENSFSRTGTYYCNSDASRCNFGFQDASHMTIMSYGTNLGNCVDGPRPTNRVYVFSGYPVPDSDPPMVLGTPCGSSSGNWNRGVFEGNWNAIAGYYSSSSCPFFSCPSPPPAGGCVCSQTPVSSAPQTSSVASSSSFVVGSPASSNSSASEVQPSAAPAFFLATGEELRKTGAAYSGNGFTVGAEESVGVSKLTGYWALVRTSSGNQGWYPQSQLSPPYPSGQTR